jgi:hypothetical protein
MWSRKVEITLEFLFQSFLAGLGLILSSRGMLLLLITIVLGILGIIIRTRGVPHLALILILLIFVLNLHVFKIFPIDSTAQNLISLSNRAGPLSSKVLVIIAKAVYNAGILLIPFLIYMVSLAMVGQPAPQD